MAHETDDKPYSNARVLGDLDDVKKTNVDTAGSKLLWDAADDQYESVAPSAAIADLVAITGGEAPTEAEYNLVVTKVNALLAAARTQGVILP